VIDRNKDDVEDGGADASTTATTPSVVIDPATEGGRQALADLPRSTPLGRGTLVTAREVSADDSDLYLVDIATGTGPQLTDGVEEDLSPVLSPDRNTVIYLRRYADGRVELRAVAPNAGDDRELFSGGLPDCTEPGRPAWSPEEPTQLVLACYDQTTPTLRLLSVDGQTIRPLPLPADTGDIDDLSFSPDGTHVAYWANTQAESNAGNLYIQAVDGSDPRRITRRGTDNGPVWAPDGDSIAFSRGADGARGIHVLEFTEDAEPEPLIDPEGNSERSPAWSPDGNWIVFRSDRDGEAPRDQLWIATAEGEDLDQLTSEGEAVSAPSFGSR
jgi:Tol biopolymer transport system component